MRQDRLRLGVATRCALLLSAALACTSSGRFHGEVTSAEGAAPAPARQYVEFTWSENVGGDSGRMYARLANGQTFRGTYHQITRYTRASALEGFYGGWYGGGWYGSWGGWPYYGSVDQFITYYTGHVVAILQDDAGRQMRCRFELIDAAAGLPGGGTGECQTSGGTRVTAWFGPID